MGILEVELLEKWSSDRDVLKQEHTKFHEEPKLPNEFWTEAYLTAIERRQFTHAFVKEKKVSF